MLQQILPLLTTLGLSSPTQQVLLFTDFHLDKYYGTKHAFGACTSAATSGSTGSFGCDAPSNLIVEVVQAGKEVLPEPDFVLVCGDSVRHDAHTMPNGWVPSVVATLVSPIYYRRNLT